MFTEIELFFIWLTISQYVESTKFESESAKNVMKDILNKMKPYEDKFKEIEQSLLEKH